MQKKLITILPMLFTFCFAGSAAAQRSSSGVIKGVDGKPLDPNYKPSGGISAGERPGGPVPNSATPIYNQQAQQRQNVLQQKVETMKEAGRPDTSPTTPAPYRASDNYGPGYSTTSSSGGTKASSSKSTASKKASNQNTSETDRLNRQSEIRETVTPIEGGGNASAPAASVNNNYDQYSEYQPTKPAASTNNVNYDQYSENPNAGKNAVTPVPEQHFTSEQIMQQHAEQQSANNSAKTEEAMNGVDSYTEQQGPAQIPQLKGSAPGPLAALMSKANMSIAACNTKGATAAKFCLASSSPSIHQGMLLVGGLVSGVSAAKTVSESCSTYNKAMKAAKVAMTAYATSCAIVQSPCDTACTAAITNLNMVKAYIPSSPWEAPSVAAAKAQAGQSLVAAGAAASQCSGYLASMASAGAGILNLVIESKASSSCENKTTVADCAKNPSDPACSGAGVVPQTPAQIAAANSLANNGLTAQQQAEQNKLAEQARQDCSRSENANMSNCICSRAPTLAGCSGANGTLSSAFGSGPGTGSNGSVTGGGTSGAVVGYNADGSPIYASTGAGVGTGISGSNVNGVRVGGQGTVTTSNRTSGTSSSNGTGTVSTDGSSVNGGLTGGSASATSKTGATDRKAGFNSNILQGTDGGGGGGGVRLAGGGDGAGGSAYNAYLPGGEKDPNRSPASAGMTAAAFKAQVTSSGSKTNWEKISERYRDYKSSLMQGP